jgi:hypothetical protein
VVEAALYGLRSFIVGRQFASLYAAQVTSGVATVVADLDDLAVQLRQARRAERADSQFATWTDDALVEVMQRRAA